MGNAELLKELNDFLLGRAKIFKEAGLITVNLATNKKGLLCHAQGEMGEIMTLICMAMKQNHELAACIRMAVDFMDELDAKDNDKS